ERELHVSLAGATGVVRLRARVASAGGSDTGSGRLRVGASVADLEVTRAGTDVVEVEGEVRVDDARLWWPHTHGAQPLYDVVIELDGAELPVGRVGFRTIEVDRADGAFALCVNGTPIFCRGACWVPLDPVTLTNDPDTLRQTLEALRAGGMNMVRLTGTMVYEDTAFWDQCDELGILVWQDAMFANVDPPDDDDFLAEVEAELASVFAGLQGRPSLAVVCGGSEIEQQAAMMGRDANEPIPLLDRVIPTALQRWLPGVPYARSTPTGGDLPFHVDEGVGHYYGVGAYRRPLEDARRAGVRFTPECLAFATPPEAETVERHFGAGGDVGGERWKAAVPRDRAADWDFEDITDFYVSMLHGADAAALRRNDPARALDLARATLAHLVDSTLSEWRRPGSTCDGALLFTLRDLVAGAGWGLIDALGRPKASWYAARRVLQPVALLATDEGLNGLHLHLLNDTADDVAGYLQVATHSADGHVIEFGGADIVLPARQARTVSAESLLGAFRDLTYAYRFGPPAIDDVSALLTAPGGLTRRVTYLPGGQQRPVTDIGLSAVATPAGDGWRIDVTGDRLAQWVAVDVPGRAVDDSWFHVPAGVTYRCGVAGADPPSGTVRALNHTGPVPITVGP
ncbi:MAG: beta-mannosidase, partial [Actinomycetota bacterium]|nr:beta-mannosidase [Actinomycetota bacterium]